MYEDGTLTGPGGATVRNLIFGDLGGGGALEEWNFVTDWGNCIPIVLVTSGPAEAVVAVGMGTLPPAKDGGDVARALTRLRPYADCWMSIELASITFNRDIAWESEPFNRAYRTALHELGHVLGLNDERNPSYLGTLMFYRTDPANLLTAPDSPAIAGVQTVYGNFCNDVCGRVRRFMDIEVQGGGGIRFRFGSYNSCIVPGCPICGGAGVARESAGPHISSITHEVAMADSADAFVSLVTLPDSVFTSGVYDYDFGVAHTGVTFRLRTMDGAAVLEETYSYPPLDIVPAVGVPPLRQPSGMLELALEANPGREYIGVSFELTESGPATLELFDLMGRPVARFALGDRHRGSHSMRVKPPSGLRAGMYVLRLMQGGLHVSRKVLWLP